LCAVSKYLIINNIFLVSRVEPVIVQPCTVAYTAQRVPVSRISGTLQPISTAPRQITVSQLSASLKTLTPVYTTCQLPVARVSGSLPGIALPQASLGTAITACRLPISIRTISHPTSIEKSSTGSQLNRPPPPAILLVWKFCCYFYLHCIKKEK